MKKALLLLVAVSLLAVPFDANLRVKSQGSKIIYSTRLNLVEFNSSKIIGIIEQQYDTVQDQSQTNQYKLVYIIYF